MWIDLGRLEEKYFQLLKSYNSCMRVSKQWKMQYSKKIGIRQVNEKLFKFIEGKHIELQISYGAFCKRLSNSTLLWLKNS